MNDERCREEFRGICTYMGWTYVFKAPKNGIIDIVRGVID